MASDDPWPARLLAEFDVADARAAALAGSLSADQLNWRRNPSEWSVGQCLDHLRAANALYTPAMADALNGRPQAVVQEITPGWFGRRVDATILERFLDSNRALRSLIARASRHDVNRIRFRNPFVPLVRFTVGTGLEILSKHQRRHLLQAERIRNAPGFPA